jgi:excisionase family DNA binding protein
MYKTQDPGRPYSVFPAESYQGLVDKKFLARYLNLSPRTIETWTRLRKIPCYKLGIKAVRYRLSDVEKALQKRRVKEVAL